MVLNRTTQAVDGPSSSKPNVSAGLVDPPSIDAALDVLVRMMRLPNDERQMIRRELAAHLSERVRDLQLDGVSEPEAIRQSLSELGELSDLAHRFEHANQRQRRLLMNATLIGIGAVATLVGVFTLGTPSSMPSTATVFESPQAEISDQDQAVFDQTLSIEATNQSLQSILNRLDSAMSDVTITAYWDDLAHHEISPDTALSLQMREVRAQQALDALARVLEVQAVMSYDRIEWRLDQGVIEFGLQSEFDRHRAVLASYYIDDILASIQKFENKNINDAINVVSELIYEFVETDRWAAMGGAVAQLHVVNGRMFIQAPPRMHEKVEWILAQLRDNEGQDRISRSSRPFGSDSEER